MSNREAVRDGFFALLREALASADALGGASSLSGRGSQALLDPGAEPVPPILPSPHMLLCGPQRQPAWAGCQSTSCHHDPVRQWFSSAGQPRAWHDAIIGLCGNFLCPP